MVKWGISGYVELVDMGREGICSEKGYVARGGMERERVWSERGMELGGI